jgi:hypothetical protein
MKTIKLSFLVLAGSLLSVGLTSLKAQNAPAPAPAADAPKYDFGDFSSSTLTGKAWKAAEAKDYAAVDAYTGKCIEMFQAQALEMQKGLTEPAKDKEEIFKYWALNDVGTCYYVKAKALDDQKKTKEALEAYKYLADNLSFAQCYDPKGWFWKPADAAKKRVTELEFDAAQ